MKGPETRLRKKIQAALEEKYPSAVFLKIHGNPYQNAGIPDLLCCVEGRFIGLEVKCPGKHPTDIQLSMIRRLRNANGIAEVVTSVEEALLYVRQASSYL